MTNHALQRFIERGGPGVKSVTDQAELREMAHNFLRFSDETTAFTRNETFMSKLYARHGRNKQYTAFVVKGLIFLGVIDGRRRDIITVLDQASHYLTQFRAVNNS
jgi:hypothetical protein